MREILTDRRMFQVTDFLRNDENLALLFDKGKRVGVLEKFFNWEK